MWGCPRGGFGRVESEFGVKNDEKLAPEVKNEEKLEIQKNSENLTTTFLTNLKVPRHFQPVLGRKF